MPSVYEMVSQMIGDSKEKLAAQNHRSQAQTTPQAAPSQMSSGAVSPVKVASALEYLADNINLVVDTRSPREKLAEYSAIVDGLRKQAMDQGPHQMQRALASHQPPTNPPLVEQQPGAGNNQLLNVEAVEQGPAIEPGSTGSAPPQYTSPRAVQPGESAYPGDQAGTALPTDYGHVPGGGAEGIKKIAQQRARTLTQMVARGELSEKTAAFLIKQDQIKLAQKLNPTLAENAKRVREAQKPSPGAEVPANLVKKAQATGVPPHLAKTLLKKLAADESGVSISSGTTPVLQTAMGADSAQSQGRPTGEQVPPMKGSDQGRAFIQSNEAAINATKRDLKTARTRAEMSKHLNNPAFDAGADNVLQQSLVNASSSGVKIAAATAMLQKWASESPEKAAKLQAAISKVKMANEMMGYEGETVESPMPGEAGDPALAMEGDGVPPVSDTAIAAAAAGVDPDELALAELMLLQQGRMLEDPSPEIQAGVSGEEEPAAPEAGAA